MKPRPNSNTKPSHKVRPVVVEEKLSKRLYTCAELMRLTGISRKQVSYWAQTDLVVPTLRKPMARGSRPAMFYSARDVVKALTICELLKAKFSLQQVRQIAENLEEHGIDAFESECYLLTDGYSVYYAKSDSEAIDILKAIRQLHLLLSLHEQAQKLTEVA
jgi:DNA-binding transcriptional MerR regulator